VTITTFSRASGEQFKDAERALRNTLTPGLPAVLRLDGRAFHSYCRGLARPFDEQFMADMDATALALARGIDGVRLAYVQSDEISLLLSDGGPDCATEFMFGGQIQKLVSISAAIASSETNARRLGKVTDKVALFDSRAFSLPDEAAVTEYFQWRQADARVNSLSMLASAHFSHKTLHSVPNAARVEMLEGAGVDVSALPDGFVHGRVILRRPAEKSTTFYDRRVGRNRTVHFTRMEAYAAPAPAFDDGLAAAAF
jgi:tRNA(His) 5'-end guanylyltransferase